MVISLHLLNKYLTQNLECCISNASDNLPVIVIHCIYQYSIICMISNLYMKYLKHDKNSFLKISLCYICFL